MTDRPERSIQPAPDAFSLLRTARETLKTLLDDLPAERRYEALMVVNAMAVAMRELERDDDRDRRRLEQELGRLLGSPACLDAMWRAVIAELRGGAMDPARRRALHAILSTFADARLQVANPGYAVPGHESR